jgi:hypothetical protein
MRRIRAILLLAIVASTLGAASPAMAVEEADRLKAALIFNILRFVDFTGKTGGPIRLCLPRDVEARSTLAALNGRASGGRTIAVQATTGGSTQGCDAIYLGRADAAAIRQVRRDGLLIIGDGPAFIGAGGMIGLVQLGKQVRFEVNNRVARQHRISISSQLLRLAARIEQ